jgi:two-component system sensor histidine kinase/response regulator
LIVRGQVVGTIGLDDTKLRVFTEDEVALAMNIAASAAQALDRAWTGERLRESQRALSTLMSNLPGMAYRSRNDADWTMEFVSEGCLELTGYHPADLVQNAKISYAQLIHPEDRDHVRHAVELALQDNSPFYLVYRIITSGGKGKWVWEQGREVVSTEGEPLALEGFITDISEQVEREDALRRSTQMLSLHVQQTPLAYIEWNPDLEVLDWNPAAERIFGYSKHEVLHRHAYELIVPPKVVPQVDKVWLDVLNQAGGTRSTNENVTKDGRTIVCEWYNTPLVDSEGHVTGLASLVQDVTERVRAEEGLRDAMGAAEEANRAKSTFLANMSHELRTPLNAILGFSQLMVTDPSLTVEQRENLEIISDSGAHLLALINDVLAMSKIEAGQSTLYKQSFDLYLLLDSIRDTFRLHATKKGLRLILDRAPDVPQYVRTDESKLRQVLANLLSNAVKFTHEGGVTLRVGYEEEASKLLFEVQDTGVGIATEDLESLFDPFVQTTSGHQSQEGTGLGLPISRQYVHLMGGEITVSSVLEWGTVFKFDVKVDLAGASDTQAEGPTRRVVGLEPNQPIYRLLVVDNRPADRKLLVSLLSKLGSPPRGFNIREAENGREALEIWEQWEPHLIWMDMRMPVMSGHEATKRIKATTKGQATVIVALTASAFEEDRQLILSEGCDDFVRKPFREAEIYDRLTKHLGVRFLSEAIEPSAQLPSATETGEVAAALQEQLAAAAWAGLPDTWTAELHQAAVQADGELVLDLAEQIRPQHAAVADALTSLVHNYRYDIIVTVIQELGE